MQPIYLDYNATTPIDPAVLEAMTPYLQTDFGNPSSTHVYGKTAHDAVERARAQVASLIGAQPDEIVFTGGGTEASNHAIKGAVYASMSGFFARWFTSPHVIISDIEHPATLQPCAFLKRLGCKITSLGVDRYGSVDPFAVENNIGGSTSLVSIMHANNEVGTIQPIRDIAQFAKARGVLVHTDAAQSLGKIPVNVNDLDVDLLSIAGHKLYAPKGIGALYIRRGAKIESLMHGAGHEAGRRAGTENVPYIVGLGKACEVIQQNPSLAQRMKGLRDRLYDRLHQALGDRIVLNGHPDLRLPNTLNINILGQIGADFLKKVPEIAASTGSACHEGSITQSPVLCAMGVPPEIGQGAVRLSVGRFTTEEEIDRAAEIMVRAAIRA
ncbi:MAG: cysteine desulfurase [Planctomycetes bacterium]|nr:cysteine desulfurase [Planctomycetota bacterium]